MTYYGAWSSAVSYGSNAVVIYQGTSYLATTASTGERPDLTPSVWAVLSQAGATGPSGPSGAAATISIGTVTTGAPGSQAAVTNSGSGSAAVLNFAIPQGAAGTGGTGSSGGGSTSGIPYASIYHGVSFNAVYLSVNSPTADAQEDAAVLTWVPNGCTASQLQVYSQQSNPITVTLRTGNLSAMENSSLACSVSTGNSCTVSGTVTVPAGNFVDLVVSGPSGTTAGVWTALTCN